jgi:hypothetical protein
MALLNKKIPARKLTDRYRPKADRAFLSDANKTAWEVKSAELTAKLDAEASEIVTTYLEGLYPIADMLVLKRYDVALTKSNVHVHVYNPVTTHWDHPVTITLSRSVLTPSSLPPIFSGGRRYSEEPDGGLNAETVASIKAGTHADYASWEAYLESHRKRERMRVPREIEPLLHEVVQAGLTYRQQYNEIMNYPLTHKNAFGQYPMWEHIASAYPTTGQVIRHRIAIGWERV